MREVFYCFCMSHSVVVYKRESFSPHTGRVQKGNGLNDTSCDLKRLRIANGGQFVFLPLSDSHSICWEAKMIISIFNLLFNIHKQTLYDYRFSKFIHF